MLSSHRPSIVCDDECAGRPRRLTMVRLEQSKKGNVFFKLRRIVAIEEKCMRQCGGGCRCDFAVGVDGVRGQRCDGKRIGLAVGGRTL